MRTVNILAAAVFFALSLFIFVGTLFFKQTLISDQFLGAHFFPRLVAAVMAALSLVLLFQQLLPQSRSDRSRISDIFNRSMAKPAAVVALFCVYVPLLGILGFFLSTTALFSALLAVLGNRRKAFFLVGPLFTALIEFIFVILFRVQLPGGIVGF